VGVNHKSHVCKNSISSEIIIRISINTFTLLNNYIKFLNIVLYQIELKS